MLAACCLLLAAWCSAGPGHPVWEFGSIYRMSRDGTDIKLVARGVRNTVGFDWHPVTKKLFFTDNGRGKTCS